MNVDITRLVVTDDPDYTLLVRALVDRADEMGDQIDKARASKTAAALAEIFK